MKHRVVQSACSVLALLVVATVAPASLAQETGEQDRVPPNYNQASATVERIMDAAVRNIGRRYNLREDQLSFTDAMMKREVRGFLKDHESEIWPAILGLLNAQMGIKPPDDQEEQIRLGKASLPLAKLAQEAILRANAEWHEILTEEQQRLHEYDMTQMQKTFSHVNERFEEWSQGKATAKGIFPSAPPAGSGPPLPHRPGAKEVPPLHGQPLALGILDTLVEEFMKEHDLDESQLTSARSILVEFKDKANSFKKSKQEAFAKIDAQLAEARRKRDTKQIKAAMAAHKELLAPFHGIIGEMEHRLMALLTTAQKEIYAEKQSARDASRTAAANSSTKSSTVRKTSSAESKPKKAPIAQDADKKESESKVKETSPSQRGGR